MRLWLLLPLLLLFTGGTACEDCSTEFVEATMPATLQGDSGIHAIMLVGSVTEANIFMDWPLVVTVAIRGATVDTVNALVWALAVLGSDTSGPAQGALAVIVPVPVTPGDSIRVDSLGRYGGYGVLDLPAPFAAASFGRGAFSATAVSGFFKILRRQPLQLRLDLTFSNQAGASWVVKGDMTFRLRIEQGACT